MIFRSLGAKLLVLVTGLTALVFAGLFLTTSSRQNAAMLDLIRNNSARTAELLQMAIDEPMTKGDNAGTLAQFQKFARNRSDIRVYLTDFKGNVTYATDPAALRRDFDRLLPDPLLVAALRETLGGGSEASRTLTLNGVEYLADLGPVRNAPSCHHCHGRAKPVLGTMVVLQDISGPMATLRNTRLGSLAISLAGMALLLGALLFFIRREVVRRVKVIDAYSRRVTDGDLNACLAVDGRDELASLGACLGDMVCRIKDQLEYTKSILAGIVTPLFVSDAAGAVEFANAPLLRILGRPQEDILGRRLPEVFPGSPVAVEAPAVRDSGESRSGQTRFTRPDGREYPLRFELSPLRDASGQTNGVIGVLLDLTQEEQAKADIEQQRRNLLDVASQVTGVAHGLADAAQELLAQMTDLTRSVERTADQTTQVATAMEEMNATVMEVAKSAHQTAEAADQASRTAEQGNQGVQGALLETGKAASATTGLAVTLSELSDQAKNIGAILTVISDIADQTNLLALNAAIEAARAGDAGRGFAVVADEVRKLAEKTMQATSQVAHSISLIQDSAAGAVMEMDDAKRRVEKTADMAKDAGGFLVGIVQQSGRIADMVRIIATAAKQQSATSDEINQSVSQINDLSHGISKSIHLANDTIDEVSDMATRLNELVARFKD